MKFDEVNGIRIAWYASAEEIDGAFWGETLKAEGLTPADLADGTMQLQAAGGREMEASHAEVLEAIKGQGVWAFCDHSDRSVHAWAATTTDPALVIEMLAHEIGHLTDGQPADDIAAEVSANTFGRVASTAWGMLAKRPAG